MVAKHRGQVSQLPVAVIRYDILIHTAIDELLFSLMREMPIIVNLFHNDRQNRLRVKSTGSLITRYAIL